MTVFGDLRAGMIYSVVRIQQENGFRINAFMVNHQRVMDNHPINTFSRYCRRNYGQRVGKIALDTGAVCPNRKRGGCIFCNPAGFTPHYLKDSGSLSGQLSRGKSFLASRKFRKYFAYFQQETTTALATSDLMPLVEQAVAGPDCLGLIISTRPDYLDDELLDALARLPADREILIELGLQSAHDATLAFLNRNHTFADFQDAAKRILARGRIELGAHLILGIPGEGFTEYRETVRRTVAAGVDYLKFHHLQVMKNTRLAAMYEENPFRVYTPEDYLQDLAQLLSHVPGRIVIHRLWSTADPAFLLQPRWDTHSSELHNRLLEIMSAGNLYQGKNADGGRTA